MKRYTLTYFDSQYNKRIRYLNGASWLNIKGPEDEYKKLMKEEKRRERISVFSTRSKWAIMCTDSVTKKTVLVKKL